MNRKLLLVPIALAALAACRHDGMSMPAASPASAVAAPALPNSDAHRFAPDIDGGDFGEMVRVLSSDAFEGRGPGTPGEDKSVAYITAQMRRIGLQPGNKGSWTQDVPMLVTTADPATTLDIARNGTTTKLKFGDDMVVSTRSGQPEVKLEGSDMVFVGYGVDAPEQKWNDYAGQDWRGKTVVMLVNDPGFHVHDESLFEGRKMTYYGRWTYKFEEAARQHAAAAIIIHDTEGAAYGWDVVKHSWGGKQYDLRAADDPDPRVPLQGWITQSAAKALFANAGLDLDDLYKAANKRGFKPVPLHAKLSVDLRSTISEQQSRNVIGVLPGGTRPDEAVVYMAHWDHLGKHDDEPGDNIYNGAVDNAAGVAGILEIADRFAHQRPAPQRSTVFIAPTLEEAGLLGSKYYAAHPSFALDKIAGVLNIDAILPIGKTRDITVTGFGASHLEDILKTEADKQALSLHAEENPEGGHYFRSDHFSFAKAGVPALDLSNGADLVDGGIAAGKAAEKDYGDNRYHSPRDEYDPATWKFDGIVQLLGLEYAVGNDLANSDAWPDWYDGNAFKAARDAMMKK